MLASDAATTLINPAKGATRGDLASVVHGLFHMLGMAKSSEPWTSETLFAGLIRKYQSAALPNSSEVLSYLLQEFAAGSVEAMEITHDSVMPFGPCSPVVIQMGWWPEKHRLLLLHQLSLLAELHVFQRQVHKVDGRVLMQHPAPPLLNLLKDPTWRQEANRQIAEVLWETATTFPQSAISVHRALCLSLVETETRLLAIETKRTEALPANR
jgi:hypothetical protein